MELPPMTFDEEGYYFEGEIALTSWAGYQSRQGDYGSVDSSEPSKGVYPMTTGGEEDEIHDYHKAAYRYLIENEARIHQCLVKAIEKEYNDFRNEIDGRDREKEMPSLVDLNDLKKYMGLSQVYLHDEEKDGVGYIGFEFGCTWDTEHGLGVLLHKDQVIEIGFADCAILGVG